ncbi:glycosyltransferase [Pseudodesulfovibrio tunisiensis]|uniref:glycosyltransferase n=1 Tax=Pseudodesulfovibrio tunisiensis TaxID=463192 RepID=UPI001FB1A418|nr:glycosyltransferase [Pseudodesulfovibrio tunisiensis]
MSKKIALLVQGGNGKFLSPVRDWFSRDCEVREFASPDTETLREALAWADLTWIEWVQDLAAEASRMKRRGKLVARLHSFEAYTPGPTRVLWQNVDALCVVAPHVTEILKIRMPDLESRTRVVVLPNGVDMKRFTLKRDFARTGKIAFAGQLRHTKNLPLVLQCFASAADSTPDLTLHIAGEYAGEPLERMELAVYLNHMIHVLGLNDRVHFHGQVADMNAWLEDKDALISCSMRESFGYNIAEAMAKGIFPAIHHFPGAGGIFPAECIFNTVRECRSLLLGDRPIPRSLRAYALSRFPLERQQQALAELVHDLIG